MATLKGAILQNVQYDFEDTEARETAQSALTQAETNANDITTAETNITTAQTTADEAKTAAATAQTTADEAKTAAATAQTTADKAQATAEEKMFSFGTALTKTITTSSVTAFTSLEMANIFGKSSVEALPAGFYLYYVFVNSSGGVQTSLTSYFRKSSSGISLGFYSQTENSITVLAAGSGLVNVRTSLENAAGCTIAPLSFSPS